MFPEIEDTTRGPLIKYLTLIYKEELFANVKIIGNLGGNDNDMIERKG